MMRNKIITFMLSMCMAVSVFTGCGTVNETKPVIEVNDQNVNIGTAMMFLRVGQVGTFRQAEQLYTYYGMDIGSEYWDEKIDSQVEDEHADDESTDTVEEKKYDIKVKTKGDNYKQDVIDTLKKQLVLKEHMSEYGDNIFTEEDEKNIEIAASKFMEDNGEADFIKLNNITEDSVKEYLELYTISKRVQEKIEDEVDTNVSDNEAMQTTITYIMCPKEYEKEEDDDVSAKEHMNNIMKKLGTYNGLDGINLNTIAQEENSNITASTYTFGKNDTYKLPEDVMTSIDSLSDGTVGDIIESEDAYYIVRMDAKEDKEATENKKNSIIRERKSTQVEEKVKAWEENSQITVDTKFWNKIKVKDNEKYIIKIED